MIYVTHDQIEAMTMGDRIVVMNNGKVQQTDTPLKLYNEPDNLFVAGFLGSAPMNFITGELKQERDTVVFKERQGGTIEVRFKDRPRAREFFGKPMLLGVRPEDIEVTLNEGPLPARNTLAGVIEALLFVGDRYEARVALGGEQRILLLLPRAREWREGQRLQLRLPPEVVSVWPA